MRFVFDWDPRKAEANRAKHRVTFEDAMSVFLDPRALVLYDAENSNDEDRWITLGQASGSRLLLVVHTHVEISDDGVLIRIISARRPTRKEATQYRQGVE